MSEGFATSCASTARPPRSRNSWRRSSWVAGVAARRSCWRPTKTIRRLGADLQRNNDFNYKEMDPHGYAVPLGSHMRRMNPRDTAANMNRRRMIRRGATYGSHLPEDAPEDGTERGIAAFVICASLIRQFEFAQNVWTNDRNFHELGNERDPIIGNQDGTLEFKIPKRPIRKKITGLPAFTTVRGGAYFFLPGIKALRYLATLRSLSCNSKTRGTAMSTLTPARTYNQNHIPRKYTAGKRRLSIYWTWSYPWEAQRDPAAMENRFSTMTEVRNVLWPDYETPEWSAAQFLQGIAGTLELFHRSTLSFQQIAGEVTGHPVAVFQRIDQAGYKLPIDERILADTDTLLVFGLDHLLSEQEAAPEEIAAIREWLKREGTCLLLAPHHDVGFTDDLKQRQMEYLHHRDALVPRQQRFGQYTRSLMKALDVPVHNTYGLRPALVKGTKEIAPLTAFRDIDKLGLLNNVPTLNFHPHLPHYEITSEDTKSVHLLARQPIDLDRPHPFTEAGNTEFNCLLWMPPNQQRAGDIVLVGLDQFHHALRWHGKPSKPLAEFRPDEMNAGDCRRIVRLRKVPRHDEGLRNRSSAHDGLGESNADGTVEQGLYGRHAKLRRLQHARDGCRSHGLADFRAASATPGWSCSRCWPTSS